MKSMSKGFKETKNLKRIMELLEKANGNDDEIVGFIYETKDYSKFKRIKGNRQVDHPQIIVDSIKKHGVLNCPINVNEEFGVADGQNRVLALEQMGLPVRYIVSHGIGIKECQAMNSGQKNWSADDFVNSYAEDGDDRFIALKEAKKKHKLLGYDLLLSVANGGITCNNANELIKNKAMEYHPPTYKEETILEFLEDVYPHIKKSGMHRGTCMRALASLACRGYIDPNKMRSQFEKYATAERFQYATRDIITTLQELYNHNRKSQEYFADDYKKEAYEKRKMNLNNKKGTDNE